jgi:serine/threonine-protein kinase
MNDARRPGGDPSDGTNREPEQFGGFEAADPAVGGWGTAFGSGYLLQREIGVGGMGTVWRGWALDAQHAVAIKILHPHLSGDPGVVGRFLREGDVLKRLDHPNLVAVHDLVVEGGKLGLVMDLVEGGDLHARRKRHGTLPPAEVARIGAQSAGALAAAHALGVAHLDLKPANILISTRPHPDGIAELDDVIDVRLTDFGIARLIDSPDQATTTTTYGTPDYMAPEIGLTGTSGPASDLYALGITLYELIVGRTPHGGGQALAVLARHIERRPKRIPGIPDALWEVIDACTAREPGDRPEAAAVAETLAVAEPALVGLPALEAIPRTTNFQVTSEPRNTEAESTTVAVPWLAAVAAANRLTQAVNVAANEVHEPPADHNDGAADTGSTDATGTTGEDAFAAALLKPPPSGPFSTLPQHPAPGPRVHLPAVSRNTRRRATLIGAPLVLLGVVGISLIASGAFAGTPQSPDSSGRNAVGGPGSAQAGGAGGSSSADSTTAAAKTSASKPASKPKAKGKSPSASSTNPASSESTAPGNEATTIGGSTTTTVATTPASITTTSPPPAAPPAATNTGLVCRSGGFKNLGGFSEDPCIQDDNGTLTLKGELKGGTYNTAMVIVVRVDDGGTYSSAHVSKSVTPSQLGDQIYVYSVTLGSWPAGEVITCEENVDKATTPTDYTYGSNSADIKTTS